MSVKIEKVILADGKTVRYRARGVSVGKDPVTGKRMQRTISGAKKKDVEAEVTRIGAAVDKGVYTRPWNGTLSEVLDSYLREAAKGKEASTRAAYRHALRIPRERLGHRRALSITRDDIRDLVDFAAGQGRVRGGKPGTALSLATVRMMLTQLSAAFEQAIDDEKLARNPCRKVKADGAPSAPRDPWSEDDVQKFIAASSGDRLAACWLLSLLGLRRGEVTGLRWADVSLTEGTISIENTRVTVGGQIVEKGPKSKRGRRTLPLFEPVTGVLELLYKAQLAERDAAGAAYAVGSIEDGYVCADETGQPMNPQTYSDSFTRLCREAGLRRIRLHDCRHSTNSLLEHLGVSDSIRAAWFGHTIAVNRSTYTHASSADLAVISGALGGIFTADVSKA